MCHNFKDYQSNYSQFFELYFIKKTAAFKYNSNYPCVQCKCSSFLTEVPCLHFCYRFLKTHALYKVSFFVMSILLFYLVR